MKVNLRTTLLVLTLVISPFSLFADGGEGSVKRFTISGVVTDQVNGETLLGATIYVNELETGTATNLYGFYSIT
ncbi:MAG TPA: carboxypeptidase-like regulatory domain-containing protein, partial [Bacteroidales bacterium]|nr:carboxypeptidase-like regulatory domain-containing protein [Bacteroidales bacterium]